MEIDISIIVPFYNGNKYINKLIKSVNDSVKITSYKCELIIVKDSMDDEVEYNKDNYSMDIKIIKNKTNLGIHHSRVVGIENALGKYVMMLDQDDLIAEQCIESQMNSIGTNDMVIGNGFDESRQELIYSSLSQQKLALNEKYYYYIGCMITSPGQCLIKKDAIPSIWTKKFIKNNGSDDLLLWLLMFNHRKKMVINNHICYTHVATGENISDSFSTLYTSCQEVLKYLEKYDSVNRHYKRILENRLEMRRMYEGKFKIFKILAMIVHPKITLALIIKKAKGRF
ncbi:MAG: glycosyltransferase family 2 protein [Thomasclavelia sp.]|nr:glycosyltransferase family 2 protein [Thomasclavelia sp.]